MARFRISARYGALFGLALGSFVPAAALAAPPTTLTQALAEAYANNATLQQQRASLRVTDEQVPTALSGWRPTVQITGTAGHISGTESLPATVFDPNTQSNVRVKQKLSQSRSEEIGQITLTQPIYSGGKIIASTRQAKNNVYAARATLLATEQTVFLNVVSAYVTVISDTHLLALDKSNESVLSQQLNATNDQFKVGEITETSVAQAQASLAQAAEQVEVAKGNLQIADENFRQLVGEYPGNLAPPQPLALPVASKDEAARAATANNPSVVAAKFTNAAARDAVDVAFAALMPQISLQASAFSESNPSGPNTNVNGGQVLGQLTVPLYQGGSEYAAIRSARAQQQESFAGILNAQRTAYAQATQAWEALVAARAAIISTNAEIKANAIALDGTEREELVGTRTTLDVLNAQQLLLQAQEQQVQNIATLVNNSYTVASAIGRLTATDLALPVDHYDDLKYYRDVKYAGFGTGESADQNAGITPDGALLGSANSATIADGPPSPPVP
ncbi:MAG: TolC family outer membrane protein [Acidocella sp.]|nr:TolC family outer membrane protein [Acidocella sp.]